MLCQEEGWVGLAYRVPDKDAEPVQPEPRRPDIVECPESGCCLLITPGMPHQPPCLDPDILAKTDSEFRDPELDSTGPLWVKIGKGRIAHCIFKRHRGTEITAICGRRGKMYGEQIAHDEGGSDSRCCQCASLLVLRDDESEKP